MQSLILMAMGNGVHKTGDEYSHGPMGMPSVEGTSCEILENFKNILPFEIGKWI